MSLEEIEQTQSAFHYLTHWLDHRRQHFIRPARLDAFAAHSQAAAPATKDRSKVPRCQISKIGRDDVDDRGSCRHVIVYKHAGLAR
jgi:hypothetical protein